jgi:cobalamin biosynthetic protein CobC
MTRQFDDQEQPSANSHAEARIGHGGDLGRLKALYPEAPRPWVDLSTGINPWPYPLPQIPDHAWSRLPQDDAERAAREAIAAYLGLHEDWGIVLTPGSEAAIHQLPFLVPRTTVAIIAPTYGEHAPAWRLAGHTVIEAPWSDLPGTDSRVVLLTQPNNPDGAIRPLDELRALAVSLRQRGGLLVVDEAFADLCPEASIAGEAIRLGAVVLRSFGKFFGLAGVRGGAVVAPPEISRALSTRLGPWAVSGPALAVMGQAYADTAWIAQTRGDLDVAAADLDHVLERAGLRVVGGTSLFRLTECPHADIVHQKLAGHGLAVRRFDDHPRCLRFGLPATPNETARLSKALHAISQT